jgi:signal transduction histidine kinase
MKRILCLAAALFLAVGFIVPDFADATIDEAKAMVEKAEAYMKANGKERALQEISNSKGEFVKSDLYVFAYDPTGTIIAHPINAKLIGTNAVEAPDVDGKLWRKEMLEKVGKDGSGVVDYKYKNPATNKVEAKTSYFKKVGDVILACGTYK